jgi:hypothetical protein
MAKQGWLTKQFNSARKDLEELPRWLQDKNSDQRSQGSQDQNVVQIREAKPADPRSE